MIEIVEMNANHVPQVAELEKMCFHDPWSEASVASELGNPLSLWLVAVDGEKVVGYVGSQTVMDMTDMMNIAVHPDFRRRGIAKMLVERLVDALRSRQSRCLMLEVRTSNTGAQLLYEILGFVQVGIRKNYYRNPKEDALILRKEWEI
jgi:ribosomal-protein-alanine N-acetyltransferase